MWTDLDGRRRSASLKAIDPMIRTEPANGAGAVPSPGESLRFNAARMISRSRHVSASLNALGDIVIDVHIALTPASIFWKRTEGERGHDPAHRQHWSHAVSFEASAARLREGALPSALEVTIKAKAVGFEDLERIARTVMEGCRPVGEGLILAVADYGPNWLFFPTNGYNPNLGKLRGHYFLRSPGQWAYWRQMHNISYMVAGRDGAIDCEYIIHSRAPRMRTTSG